MTDSDLPRVEVPMRRSVYRQVERRVTDAYGITLSDMTNSAPRLAYAALRSALADELLDRKDPSLRDIQPDAITDNCAEGYWDGRQALCDILAPPIEYGPHDIVVSLKKRRTALQMLSHTSSSNDEILVFTVDPKPWPLEDPCDL